MIRHLFRRKAKSAVTHAGERVYAVGDIHGRIDLFRSILKQIQIDGQERGPNSTRIVLLGDLIDRGPSSRQVLELVLHLHRSSEGFVVLSGNHEEMLLESCAGNGTMQNLWLDCGGMETLRSYGIERAMLRGLRPAELGELITRTIGRPTLEWISALPLTFRSGDYFFCHAGVRPGVALDEQRREDLLWIRDEFLDSSADHGAMIVHGHSEQSRIEVENNRINIDTAAYRTNVLSALAVEGKERWFVEACHP